MSVIFLGDLAFTGVLSTQPKKNSERFFSVFTVLNSSKLVFANLEVPLKVDENKNEYKSFIHHSLPEPTAELLKLLNIRCVSLANNHIYDCKMSGLKATINLLDELRIYHTGAGWLPQHTEPVIIELKDTKIGFLAYVDKSTNPKTEHFSELLINYFEPETVVEDIKRLKSKVDKVICSIHWGLDYSFYPTDAQKRTARKLVDAGADIIMGHHPHTMQPFEQYNKAYIFYSLGGLTFGDFLWRGKIRSLKKSTKFSFLPVFDWNLKYIKSYKTNELEGNNIKIKNGDFLKWSGKRWSWYRLYRRVPFLWMIRRFRETYIEKFCNFFFGYYRNPALALKDLITLGLRKVK